MYEITNDAGEFFNRVGILTDEKELKSLGFKPNRPAGGFEKRRSKELLAFCKQNSNYHIVSRVDEVTYVNSFTHMGLGYYLARGDSALNLALCDEGGMKKSA